MRHFHLRSSRGDHRFSATVNPGLAIRTVTSNAGSTTLGIGSLANGSANLTVRNPGICSYATDSSGTSLYRVTAHGRNQFPFIVPLGAA